MKKYDYKLGMSVGSEEKPVDEQGFRKLKEGGIEAIEISSSKRYDFNFKDIKKNSETFGVDIWSMHLPFAPFKEIDPSSLDKNLRKKTVETFSEIMKEASVAEIDKFIVHPSAEPIDDSEREERMKCSIDTMNILADIASTLGAVIAVEDLPRTCLGRNSEEINRLISENDKLRVCFDTNHLLEEDIPSFIKNVGDKIITTHVSDYDFKNERHWLPGEGDIEWLSLLNALNEVNYNGIWLYEIGLSCPDTINRRTLEFKDFYDNAQTLFDGEIPTPIGTRKEDLKNWR